MKCEFSNINLQLKHRTISCKFSRDNLSLETADELFAGYRLTGTVEVVRGDELEGQGELFKGSLSSVTASFDVKRYAVSAEEIVCTLVLAKDDIEPLTLDGFLKRSGHILIENCEKIPEKEGGE